VADSIRIVPKTDDARIERGELSPLSELKNYMVSDPYPDFRDWNVKVRDGRTVGKVSDLIVDTNDMTVKYLSVDLHREFRLSDEDEWILVPAAAIRLDEKHDVVMLEQLPAGGFDRVPRRGAEQRANVVAEADAVDLGWEVPQPEASDVIDSVAENRPYQGN
jgi:sporulation protein YlmC with PRC-barrel domain